MFSQIKVSGYRTVWPSLKHEVKNTIKVKKSVHSVIGKSAITSRHFFSVASLQGIHKELLRLHESLR